MLHIHSLVYHRSLQSWQLTASLNNTLIKRSTKITFTLFLCALNCYVRYFLNVQHVSESAHLITKNRSAQGNNSGLCLEIRSKNKERQLNFTVNEYLISVSMFRKFLKLFWHPKLELAECRLVRKFVQPYRQGILLSVVSRHQFVSTLRKLHILN
jgi:hypothetical protein